MKENIRVLTHSSIRIEDRHIIYIDPFDMKEEPHDADFVLITHDHHDHFSPDDIKAITREDTRIIVPEAMHSKAERVVPQDGALYTIAPDAVKEIGDLIVEAVPAYNVGLKPFHPKKSGWIGYLLHVGNKRVYIAGDTDLTPDNKKVVCDIALVPVGGTYTMDAKEAAELINTIQPEVAVPIHYGSIVGKAQDAEIFRSLVHPTISVEILMER